MRSLKSFADPVDQQRDVGGGDGVAAGLEHVQRVPVTEEDRALALAHDHLRADAEIADALFGEAMYDLIGHLVRVFNDIKNSSHVISPLFG